MLLTIIGDFPAEGQSVRFGPWKISAVELANHRILQVRMEKINSEGREESDNPANVAP